MERDEEGRIKFPFFMFKATRRWRDDYEYWGLSIPRRYGYAWYNFDTDVKVYMLYPFNFIAALARRVYFATRYEIPYAFRDYEQKWRDAHGHDKNEASK